MSDPHDDGHVSGKRRLGTAISVALIGLVGLLLVIPSPSVAAGLSLRPAWYGVLVLAGVWAGLEGAQFIWRGPPPGRLARCASLLGLLTLGQALAVAATQVLALAVTGELMALGLGALTLLGLGGLAAAAVALGPTLLRRLASIEHPDGGE